jgi:hypothetical protein
LLYSAPASKSERSVKFSATMQLHEFVERGVVRQTLVGGHS